MTVICGICGKAIERFASGFRPHTTSPGSAHHYPRPLRASAGRSTTAPSAPVRSAAGLERPADVREPSTGTAGA